MTKAGEKLISSAEQASTIWKVMGENTKMRAALAVVRCSTNEVEQGFTKAADAIDAIHRVAQAALEVRAPVAGQVEEEQRVIEAAELIKAYMRRELIGDTCRFAPCMGCISCRAIDLERGLDSLTGMF